MPNAIATQANNLPVAQHPQTPAEIMETVLIKGDLARLTPEERNSYYFKLCESVGLNPLTQPIEYINLNGKLRLYAKKDCTDQLRAIHNVSVTEMTESERDNVFIVTCKVINGNGRTDIAKGAVNIKGLSGEALANALMKTETKAKRRATLSICGLGILDETEVEDIPAAQKAAPQTRAAVPSPSAASPSTAAPQAALAPETPTEPSEIATVQGEGMKAWATRYLAAIQTAKTEADMNQWDAHNTATLDLIYEKARDTVFADIQAAFEKHRLSLVMATETAPAGRPKPGAKTEAKSDPVETAPVARDLGYPDPKTDYDGFLKHCEVGMAAATTADELAAFYDENVHPHEDSLLPPDRSEIIGILDKAMRKFEP